ncbi:MAG: CoA transferase [Sphingomonadales bacterium]|nr:CoA transferase [Sphingomonadales bacterium]
MDEDRLKPLEGIRVLDFSNVPPGAACATLLADLGAEVVRVDPPKAKGKPSLVIGQVALSRGRKSIALDMRNPAANAVLARLAPGFDVVLENAFPGVMEQRGFGYAQARAANPGIIWCALTGFGQDGPYAAWSGHDISYLAHAGVLSALTADRAWHPGLPIALQAGALSAVAGIEAALIRKLRTGKGAFLDISLAEAAGWLLTCGVNAISDKPFAIPATPDRHQYACADGRWVVVACAEPRTWGALCAGLGCEDLTGQLHAWQDIPGTIARLAGLFRARPAAEWVALLAPAGAAVTVLNHAAQLLDDPHIRARGAVVDVAGVPVPASPLRVIDQDRSSGTDRTPPAVAGADTGAILSSAGFAADEIARMAGEGLI